jgi:glycosyltransferase involved in cell wall biosynthesis
MDDALFSPREVQFLNLPQVKAIVVTTGEAKLAFERLGVVRPIWVVPQGVSMEQIDSDRSRQIRMQLKEGRDAIVIGYHAPTLTLARDGPRRPRGGEDDLDFLFTAVNEARESEPRIKLWLFGEPSESVKQYAAEVPAAWIQLFGYIPHPDILNYISNVDIGVYPRTKPQSPARFNVKLAEFMACGVPVVSTKLEGSSVLGDIHCGILCDSRGDFSQALVELAQSPEKRGELGNAGLAYARQNLDWSALVPIYKRILSG